MHGGYCSNAAGITAPPGEGGGETGLFCRRGLAIHYPHGIDHGGAWGDLRWQPFTAIGFVGRDDQRHGAVVLQALQRPAKYRGIGIQFLGKRLIFRLHIIDHRSVRQHLFDHHGHQIVAANFSFTRVIDTAVDALFEDHTFFARKRLLVFLTGADVFLLDFIQVLENLL